MKMILFILIFWITRQYEIQYPNCLSDLRAQNDDYGIIVNSFNLNFLQLTEFLHEDRKDIVKQAAMSHIFQGKQDLINDYKTKLRNEYIMAIIIIVVVLSTLLVLRIKFQNAHKKLQAFIDKYIGKLLSPCVGILGITLFLFLVFVSGVINEMYDDLDRSLCQANYITEVVKEGSSGRNWAGLETISHNLHLIQDEFLPIFKQMDDRFDFSTELLMNKIFSNQGFVYSLQKQFQNGYVSYDNNMANFSSILPSFFGTKPTTLQAINSSMDNLISLCLKAHELQLSIQNLRVSKEDLEKNFPKSIDLFDKTRNKIQESNEFTPDKVIVVIDSYVWIIRISEFYLFIGFQISFGYVIVIYLSTKSRERMFKKLANVFWFLILIEIIFSFIMIYAIDEVSFLIEGYCYNLDDIIHDEQFYNKTGKARQSGILNSYQFLYPCFYNNGQFIVSPELKTEQKGVYDVITNFVDYMQMMDKNTVLYQDAYEIFPTLDDAQQQIRKQESSLFSSWTYLNTLITNLQNQTINSQCYSHHWVFNRQDCFEGEQILKSTNNNLLTYGSGKKETSCLSFNVLDKRGQINHTITFNEFMTNYLNNQNNNCSEVDDRIEEIGYKIIEANKHKSEAISPVKQKIQSQKQLISELLVNQRINYLTKSQQYEYLLTNDALFQFSSSRKKKWEVISQQKFNCSCIKDQMENYHTYFCISVRADLNKIFISVIVSIIMLSALSVIGFFIGFHQELAWINVSTESEATSNVNVNMEESSDNSSLNQLRSRGQQKPASVLSSDANSSQID